MKIFDKRKGKTRKRRQLSAVKFYFAWSFGLTLLTVMFRFSTWWIYWNIIARYIEDEFTVGILAFRICVIFLPAGMVLLSSLLQSELIQMRTGRRLKGWFVRTVIAMILCLACFYIPPLVMGFCMGWSIVSIIFMFGSYVPAVILVSLAHEKVLRQLVDVIYWNRIRYYTAWNCIGLTLYFVAPAKFYILGIILPMLIYSAGQGVLILWVLHNSLSRDYYYFPLQAA